MRFEERKENLLKQALDIRENGEVYSGFEREFFSLVESVI